MFFNEIRKRWKEVFLKKKWFGGLRRPQKEWERRGVIGDRGGGRGENFFFLLTKFLSDKVPGFSFP